MPLAVGLFFSLGHSTIVLGLSIAIAFAAKQAVQFQQSFAETGGINAMIAKIEVPNVVANKVSATT